MKVALRQSSINAIRKLSALPATVALLLPTAGTAQFGQTGYTFKAQTELVLVNVTVRDKQGNPVRGLKPEDFTVLEDSKPQKVATFDIENTENTPQNPLQQANLFSSPVKKSKASASDASAAAAQESAIKDRRLIILFFDLSSMQPDEIERSANAALDYLNKQMQPADLVSIVSLGITITVNQDFTSDRDKLTAVLQSFNTGVGAGFELGSAGTTEGTADTAQSFTVDDTEYNIFNTDRRLQALRAVAEQVANVPQKKSLIYFSSGMQRTGHREPVAIARGDQLGSAGELVHLYDGHSRPAGVASGRRGAERQPARHISILGSVADECAGFELPDTGDVGDAGGGYRRQGVPGL